MYTWEEDLLSPDAEFREDDRLIGRVVQIGGGPSYQVFHGNELIAVRPDKKTAQECLTNYVTVRGQ